MHPSKRSPVRRFVRRTNVLPYLGQASTGPELDSLNKLGHFSPSPNGDTVKRFAGTRCEAKQLARGYTKLYGHEHTVVQGAAPADMINSASKTPLSDVPGVPMQSINVPSTQVHRVQCIGSHIKQKSC